MAWESIVGNPFARAAALDKPSGQGQIGLMSYAIDTAATIADLESAGVEPSQAKAIVRAINGAAGDPASKEDFKELREDMDRRFEGMDRKFAELREEMDRRFEGMDRKFAELREEMDRKFATKADLAMLKSQLTTRILLSQVATATLLFMLLKFFA